MNARQIMASTLGILAVILLLIGAIASGERHHWILAAVGALIVIVLLSDMYRKRTRR